MSDYLQNRMVLESDVVAASPPPTTSEFRALAVRRKFRRRAAVAGATFAVIVIPLGVGALARELDEGPAPSAIATESVAPPSPKIEESEILVAGDTLQCGSQSVQARELAPLEGLLYFESTNELAQHYYGSAQTGVLSQGSNDYILYEPEHSPTSRITVHRFSEGWGGRFIEACASSTLPPLPGQ